MKGDKTDRLARFLSVLYILSNNPQGIAPQRIADQCDGRHHQDHIP